MKRAKKKKRIRPLVIVGIILASLGLCLVLSGLIVSKFDLHDFCTIHYERKSQEISDSFSNLTVKNDVADITVRTSPDNVCRIESDESDLIFNEITVKDGTLSITRIDKRHWYEKVISLSFVSPKIIVYLPAKSYNALTVFGKTGDLTADVTSPVTTLRLSGTKGNIFCRANPKNSLVATTTTGDVKIFESSTAACTVTATKGKVSVWDIKAGELTLSAASGDLRLANVDADRIKATTTKGKIILIDTIAKSDLNLKSTTGKVSLRRADARHIFIETTRGSVIGTICSDKIYDVTSAKGSLVYPSSAGSDTCTVRTTKGSVKLEKES